MRNLFRSFACTAAVAFMACGSSMSDAAEIPASRDAEISAIKAQMQMLEAQMSALKLKLDALDKTQSATPSTTMASVAAVAQKQPAPSGQPAEAAAQAAPPRAAFSRTINEIAQQPPAPPGKALGRPTPSVSLNAGSGSGAASLTLGRYPSATPGDNNWLNVDAQAVTLSAPLAKGSGPTSISNLDGLANGASAKFTWTHYARKVGNLTVTAMPAFQKRIADAQKECVTDPSRRVPAGYCNNVSFRDDVLKAYDNQAWLEAQGDFDPNALAYAWGLSGEVSYHNYSYLNSTTIKDASSSKFGWDIGGFVSLLSTRIPSSLTLSFDYQHAFKEGKSVTLCPTATTAGASSNTCQTGSLGVPSVQVKELLALDYRVMFAKKLPLLGYVAISPQVTYDFRSHDKAIDFPIYLVSNSEGALIGGVRLGYGTDDHKFVAGVFVDAPFSLFH